MRFFRKSVPSCTTNIEQPGWDSDEIGSEDVIEKVTKNRDTIHSSHREFVNRHNHDLQTREHHYAAGAARIGGDEEDENSMPYCNVCHEIIKYNLECGSCRSLFCKRCIAERVSAVKKSNKTGFKVCRMTCPTCHMEDPTFVHQSGIQEEINNTKITCKHCHSRYQCGELRNHYKYHCKMPCRMKKHGCRFEGNPMSLEKHEKHCPLLKTELTLNAYKETTEHAMKQAQENYEQMYSYLIKSQKLENEVDYLRNQKQNLEETVQESKDEIAMLRKIITNSTNIISQLMEHGRFPENFFIENEHLRAPTTTPIPRIPSLRSQENLEMVHLPSEDVSLSTSAAESGCTNDSSVSFKSSYTHESAYTQELNDTHVSSDSQELGYTQVSTDVQETNNGSSLIESRDDENPYDIISNSDDSMSNSYQTHQHDEDYEELGPPPSYESSIASYPSSIHFSPSDFDCIFD